MEHQLVADQIHAHAHRPVKVVAVLSAAAALVPVWAVVITMMTLLDRMVANPLRAQERIHVMIIRARSMREETQKLVQVKTLATTTKVQ